MRAELSIERVRLFIKGGTRRQASTHLLRPSMGKRTKKRARKTIDTL